MNGISTKSIIAGVGALCLAAGVTLTSVSAQQPQQGQRQRGMWMQRGPGGPGGPGGPMGRGFGGPLGPMGIALRQLDLTEAQKGQLSAIVDGHKADFEAIRTRMQEARKALHAAMEATPVNEAAIREATAAVAAVEADTNVLRATMRTEVVNILTDEQKAKAAELKAKGDARRAAAKERIKERVKARQAKPKAQV